MRQLRFTLIGIIFFASLACADTGQVWLSYTVNNLCDFFLRARKLNVS